MDWSLNTTATASLPMARRTTIQQATVATRHAVVRRTTGTKSDALATLVSGMEPLLRNQLSLISFDKIPYRETLPTIYLSRRGRKATVGQAVCCRLLFPLRPFRIGPFPFTPFSSPIPFGLFAFVLFWHLWPLCLRARAVLGVVYARELHTELPLVAQRQSRTERQGNWSTLPRGEKVTYNRQMHRILPFYFVSTARTEVCHSDEAYGSRDTRR
jgi:hypothetical protein